MVKLGSFFTSAIARAIRRRPEFSRNWLRFSPAQAALAGVAWLETSVFAGICGRRAASKLASFSGFEWRFISEVRGVRKFP
jgi:hypothetical protein